jgi:hypothetical protein
MEAQEVFLLMRNRLEDVSILLCTGRGFPVTSGIYIVVEKEITRTVGFCVKHKISFVYIGR